MPDVVLIFPRIEMDEISRAPLSLLCLAAVLESNGYSPFILDTRIKKKYKSILRKKIKRAICVGISSMSGFQIFHGLEISNYVRQIDPSISIVWGGVHPTLCHIQTINDPRIDIVVKGRERLHFSNWFKLWKEVGHLKI